MMALVEVSGRATGLTYLHPTKHRYMHQSAHEPLRQAKDSSRDAVCVCVRERERVCLAIVERTSRSPCLTIAFQRCCSSLLNGFNLSFFCQSAPLPLYSNPLSKPTSDVVAGSLLFHCRPFSVSNRSTKVLNTSLSVCIVISAILL